MLTLRQFDQAMKISPVRNMGGIRKGNPTAVEQNNISICSIILKISC